LQKTPKSNALKNTFYDAVHPVVIINQYKFLFNFKDKHLLHSVMIKNATRFGLYGRLMAKCKPFKKKLKVLKICLILQYVAKLSM